MTSLFTINVCKTFGCRNLGCATSPDYRWPDYRLGYPALHCQACGSYPPLFNDGEFRDWLCADLTQHARMSGHFCPDCYQREVIRYGHNPGGSQRVQCQHCHKVWTPKRPQQGSTPSPEAICSIPLIAPFQGALAEQKLYLLLSFDAIRGNVIHVSSNFTTHSAGVSLHYRWKGMPPHRPNIGILFNVLRKKSDNSSSAVSLMRFSTVPLRLSATPTGLFFVRWSRHTAIFAC